MAKADSNIASLSWDEETILDDAAIASACERAAEASKKGMGIRGKVKSIESGRITIDFRELGGWSTLLTLVVTWIGDGVTAERRISLVPEGYTRKQVVAAGVIPVARKRAPAFASGQRFSESLRAAVGGRS